MMKKKNKNYWNGMKLILFIPMIALLLMAFGKTSENRNGIGNSPKEIVLQSNNVQDQNEKTNLVIEIKKDGNYIDNKLCSLEEIVLRAKKWQKTGREDILLILDEQVSQNLTVEVREALEDAKVYHVNQTIAKSDEIVYPAGDVTEAAKFTQGNWSNWLDNKMKPLSEGKPEGWGYNVIISFEIDKNGKVKEGIIVKGCDYPEVNEAVEKILTQIPDWKPAIKGTEKVNVLYKGIFSFNMK